MATASPELEAVAAALAGLRSATGPVARVQAVRAAARAMQGLSATDSEVLARGLIEHGAPAAGDVIARHGGDAVPPEQLVSIAQGLLALDPGEAERFAAELRDPRQRTRPAAKGPAASAPPPIPVTARSRHRPEPSPRPRSEHPRDTLAHDAGPSTAAEARVVVAESPEAGDRDQLRTALRAGPDARSRFTLLEDRPRVRRAVASGGVAQLLEAVPDGWQRRTVLRRLLDGAGGDAIGDEASTIVASFASRGDRVAAASRLQRHGVADLDQLERLLGRRDAERLRSRERRAARCE